MKKAVKYILGTMMIASGSLLLYCSLVWFNTSNRIDKAERDMHLLQTTTYEKTIDSLKCELSFLQNEYNNMWEENQIFGSMLGEIESEPGGSEILYKLYNKHK